MQVQQMLMELILIVDKSLFYLKTMRFVLTMFALFTIAQAAEAPKLTDSQMLPIIRAQRDLLGAIDGAHAAAAKLLEDLEAPAEELAFIPRARA